ELESACIYMCVCDRTKRLSEDRIDHSLANYRSFVALGIVVYELVVRLINQKYRSHLHREELAQDLRNEVAISNDELFLSGIRYEIDSDRVTGIKPFLLRSPRRFGRVVRVVLNILKVFPQAKPRRVSSIGSE